VNTPAPKGKGAKPGPTADEKMSPKEKEELIDQVEEFEGPDRREKRGTEPAAKNDSGVARS
jgi:hypothetical protein